MRSARRSRRRRRCAPDRARGWRPSASRSSSCVAVGIAMDLAGERAIGGDRLGARPERALVRGEPDRPLDPGDLRFAANIRGDVEDARAGAPAPRVRSVIRVQALLGARADDGQRHRVAAERQQAVEPAQVPGTKASRRGSESGTKPSDLDQVDRLAATAARREEGASQPGGREQFRDAAAADVARRFPPRARCGRDRSPAARRGRSPARRRCRQRALPRRAERQPGDDPRRVVIASTANAATTDRALLPAASARRRPSLFPSATARITWRGRPIGRHRRVAAVMVARQIPEPRPIGGAKTATEKGDCNRTVAANISRQIRTRVAAGKAPRWRPTSRRMISASRAG